MAKLYGVLSSDAVSKVRTARGHRQLLITAAAPGGAIRVQLELTPPGVITYRVERVPWSNRLPDAQDAGYWLPLTEGTIALEPGGNRDTNLIRQTSKRGINDAE